MATQGSATMERHWKSSAMGAHASADKFISAARWHEFSIEPPLRVALRRFDANSFDEGDFIRFGVHEPPDLARAVLRRKAEYLAGRITARAELRRFGLGDTQIGTGTMRAPVWPESIVGSISHSIDHVAAVVADRRDFASLGLDVEPLMPLEIATSLAATIGAELEFGRVAPFACNQAYATTLLFSLKESYFKCISWRICRYLDFLEVEVNRMMPGHCVVGPSPSCVTPEGVLPAARAYFSIDGECGVISLVLDEDR